MTQLKFPAGPFDYILKTAAPDIPEQRKLEADFASMAMPFVADRASALMPYMIGFEAVDIAEDGSKAVGIFGFRIRKKYVYVPVFFSNGQINGVDMIYYRDDNRLGALIEENVQRLVGVPDVELGDVSKEPRNSVYATTNDTRYPDWQRLPGSPGGLKMAEVSENLQGALQELLSGTVKTAELNPEVAAIYANVTRAAGAPLRIFHTGEPLRDFLREHATAPMIGKFAQALERPEFAARFAGMYPDPDVLFADAGTAVKEAAEKKELSVSFDALPTGKPGSPERERAANRILRNGFNVVDRRQKDKLSALTVESTVRLAAPSGPGPANVLLKDGTLTPAYILKRHRDSTRGCGDYDREAQAPTVYIYFPEVGKVILANSSTVFVSQGQDKVDTKDPLKGGVKLSAADGSKDYMLMSSDGRVLGVYCVQGVLDDGKTGKVYRLRSASYASSSARYSATGEGTYHGIMDDSHAVRGLQGLFGPGTGGATPFCGTLDVLVSDVPDVVRLSENKIAIPEDWRLVPVISHANDLMPWEPGESDERRDKRKELALQLERLSLGNPRDAMDFALHDGIRNIKVASALDCGEPAFTVLVEAEGQPVAHYHKLKLAEAYYTLLTDLRLGATDTEALMDAASDKGETRALVKLAQGLVIPPVNTPMPEQYDSRLRSMVHGPQTEITTGFTPQGEQPFAGYPEARPEEGQSAMESGNGAVTWNDAMQLAEQSADQGNRTVFDHAMIGGLSKLFDIRTALRSYVPRIREAEDRLGRVLFMLNWHNEEFTDISGETELSMREDELRSSFKQVSRLSNWLEDSASDKGTDVTS